MGIGNQLDEKGKVAVEEGGGWSFVSLTTNLRLLDNEMKEGGRRQQVRGDEVFRRIAQERGRSEAAS
ncbi:hypothetical protein COLO4_21359 [Corchorus olitorius]|uniref:Uncharacterized protein n=1 Tax=Corchorus olitorius TaxID=93759 RepID=A0A1R3ITR3_9ROSI|nr:hypothetical protein COLO4_21359 [Corchorus olitorius]